MKKIVFTGGGTAGHVMPNLAIIPYFLQEGWEVHYIGTKEGIEASILSGEKHVLYHIVHSGKLRRYFDAKNFKDPFRVMRGIVDAFSLIRKIKPNVVFSKGGFVSVPVVVGAWLNGIPIVIHESDMTPGLANKLSIPFAQKVCYTFPDTATHVGKKGVFTGSPIRSDLLNASAKEGLSYLGFDRAKPIILLMGGSLGSVKLNEALRQILPKLLVRFYVVHLCGKGNLDDSLQSLEGYRQFEFLKEELPPVLAACDLVVSRAGSNAIHEFLALKKPNLLIPLSGQASRGDQILNAESFLQRGYSYVLKEEALTADSLYLNILNLHDVQTDIIQAMADTACVNGVKKIIVTLLSIARTDD